jgi:hypothetical protein
MIINILVTLSILPLMYVRRAMRLLVSTLEHLVNYVCRSLTLSPAESNMARCPAYSDLRRLIESTLVRSDFTYNGGKDFLPLKSFELLLSRDNIQNDLPGASDNLIDFVHQKAKKTFATVVQTLVGQTKDSITRVMESFQTYGFDDTGLPIEEQLGEQLQLCTNGCSGGRHPAELGVFHDHLLWQCITQFSKNQWMFLVPKFPLNKELRVLNRNCILPFTEFGGGKKEGMFGEVIRAELRVDHQELIPQPQVSRIIHLANSPLLTKMTRRADHYEFMWLSKNSNQKRKFHCLNQRYQIPIQRGLVRQITWKN